jgi:retron-type reverse transcriptase
MIQLGGKYYTIFSEFQVPIKLTRLIKMCLKKRYRKVRIRKYLSDNFPIMNGLKQGEALSPLLVNFALQYAFRKV